MYICYLIIQRAKLLISDWLSQRAFFCNFGLPGEKLLQSFLKISQGLPKSAELARRLLTISEDGPNSSEDDPKISENYLRGRFLNVIGKSADIVDSLDCRRPPNVFITLILPFMLFK